MPNFRPMLLDFTFWDGGYVNEWEFNNDVAIQTMEGLHSAGIDIIECGIMGTCSTPGKTTKFNFFTEIAHKRGLHLSPSFALRNLKGRNRLDLDVIMLKPMG